MASACLPFMFQAVEIDGEAYWDGGFIGNPALFPLVEDSATRDLVIVQINPIVRAELPAQRPRHRQPDQRDHLQLEPHQGTAGHRAVARLIEVEDLESERYRDLFVHLIHAGEALTSSSMPRAS